MGISPRTLNGLIYQASKEGWLVFEDPLSTIEFDIIPQVVKNLKKFLAEEDKTVTIETAKGTVFKQYQEHKGVSDAPQTILALKIEQIEGDGPKMIAGHVVGKPKRLE